MTRSCRWRWARALGIGLALLLLALLIVWWVLFADLPNPRRLTEPPSLATVRFYDRHGTLLYEWIGDQPGRHEYLALKDIPLALRQATIATEDAAFYQHGGVDPWAILRAIYVNWRHGEIVSGGSTITQQVARLLLLSPEERHQRTIVRKLREAYLAWRITNLYSKDHILELYLNHNYYGNMAYGVQAAALSYFGVPARDLDLAECAMLAGLPQAPALYNPLLDEQAARQRQTTVLGLMTQADYISAEQAALALEEPLGYAAAPIQIRAPHFVMYALGQLEQRYGWETLATSGWQITTTLDMTMQSRAEAILRRHLTQLNETKRDGIDHQAHNAALVALDPKNGHVLAMVGSPDYYDSDISGAVNACLSLRQPGSAIKPITYAAALGSDYTAATVLYDVHTVYQTAEGHPYVPLNYDRQFHGPISLRESLATSSNVGAVSVLDHIGVPTLIETAQRMGIRWQGDLERFGLALTLGGGEVRLLDLTSAYGCLARGGDCVAPAIIQRIVDRNGALVAQLPRTEPSQGLDHRVAYLITDILADNQARAAAFGAHSVLDIGRPAAVKTGTSTDWRDNWTIGYTPELIAGVWVGNADNTPMIQVSGIMGAAPIWHHFMVEMSQDKPKTPFAKPEGLTQVEVCALSGQLPNAHCPYRRQELFIAGTEPTETCAMHQLVTVDAATGLPATTTTPLERRAQRVFVIWPPAVQAWAQEQALALASNTTDTQPSADPSLLIVTFPPGNSRFILSTELPHRAQSLPLTAQWLGKGQPDQLALSLDGQVIASFVEPPYRFLWPLSVGDHQLEAIAIIDDESFVSAPIRFAVEPPR